MSKNKAKPPVFVAPPKPASKPESLNINEWGYRLPNGRFKFWQGWDAAFKSFLMGVSRDPNSSMTEVKAARDILFSRGWSSLERENEAISRRTKPRATGNTLQTRQRNTGQKPITDLMGALMASLGIEPEPTKKLRRTKEEIRDGVPAGTYPRKK